MSASTSPAPAQTGSTDMSTKLSASPTSPSTPTPMTVETHLSYPSQPSPSPLSSIAGPSGLSSFSASGQQPRSRTLLKDRLYVGNLSHSVDEHALIQIFSKFGKLSNLDYLFHKSGPLKGKPRGYAFVEYVDPTDAERALNKAHDKLLRGRRLVVTFAHQAPTDAFPGSAPSYSGGHGHGSGGGGGYAGGGGYGGGGGGGDRGYRRMVNEAGRPTALSLLKSAQEGGRDRTKDKIAIMEAKLRQLEKQKEKPPLASSSSSKPNPSSTTAAVSHPSLPARPPPSTSTANPTSASARPTNNRAMGHMQHSKPSKPQPSKPSRVPHIDVGLGIEMGRNLTSGFGAGGGGGGSALKTGTGGTTGLGAKGGKVKGVKIVKRKVVGVKDKEEGKEEGKGNEEVVMTPTVEGTGDSGMGKDTSDVAMSVLDHGAKGVGEVEACVAAGSPGQSGDVEEDMEKEDEKAKEDVVMDGDESEVEMVSIGSGSDLEG